MSIPLLAYVVALALALVAQFQAQGKSLVAWAVVFVCIGLLWGQFG